MQRPSERIRLQRAFKTIRQGGGMTQTGMCCQSCSLNALLDRGADPDTTLAIHHRPGVARAFPANANARMVAPLHIFHCGNSRFVYQALENEGLRVEWTGNNDEPIVVLPDLIN